MRLFAAVLTEQERRFALVRVSSGVLQRPFQAQQTRVRVQTLFPGLAIVLTAPNAAGTWEFSGRADLVQRLQALDPGRVPWVEFEMKGE